MVFVESTKVVALFTSVVASWESAARLLLQCVCDVCSV